MFLNAFNDCDVVLDDGVNQHSKVEVAEHIAQFQHLFRQLNLKAGDKLGLLLSNRVEFVELVLAALQSGLKVFPLNWHLHRDEIAELLDLVDIDAVISEKKLAEHFLYENSALLEGLVGVKGGEAEVADKPGNIVLFTSGSTGLPKAVERKAKDSFEQLINDYQSMGKSFGLTGEGAHLVTGPLYHAAPLFFALYDLMLGAKLVIQPRFDVEQCWALLQSQEVRCSHFVATQMLRLLQNKPKGLVHCDMQLILHGAAPTPVSVKEAMIECFGPILTEYWGGSESGIVCKIDTHQWQRRPKSVGQAMMHYQVRVVDEQSLQLLNDSEVGLLQMCHHSSELPFSYIPEQAVESAEGWFDLGDLGHIEEDFVYIADRQKSKILSAGVNIYPAEIEGFIQGCEAVTDVVVTGIADAQWGQQVVAIVTSEESEGSLLRKLAKHMTGLSGFKRPKQIKVVEAIARQPNGKVRQADLDLLINRLFTS